MSKASRAHKEGHLLKGEYKKKEGWFGGNIVTGLGSVIQHIGDGINLIPIPVVTAALSGFIGYGATAIKVVGDVLNLDFRTAAHDAVKFGTANTARILEAPIPLASTADGVGGLFGLSASKGIGGALANSIIGKPVDAKDIEGPGKTPGGKQGTQLA
jgi:hypothetical protein